MRAGGGRHRGSLGPSPGHCRWGGPGQGLPGPCKGEDGIWSRGCLPGWCWGPWGTTSCPVTGSLGPSVSSYPEVMGAVVLGEGLNEILQGTWWGVGLGHRDCERAGGPWVRDTSAQPSLGVGGVVHSGCISGGLLGRAWGDPSATRREHRGWCPLCDSASVWAQISMGSSSATAPGTRSSASRQWPACAACWGPPSPSPSSGSAWGTS